TARSAKPLTYAPLFRPLERHGAAGAQAPAREQRPERPRDRQAGAEPVVLGLGDGARRGLQGGAVDPSAPAGGGALGRTECGPGPERKSTRLNSSHVSIS